jgi:hypothetical protein
MLSDAGRHATFESYCVIISVLGYSYLSSLFVTWLQDETGIKRITNCTRPHQCAKKWWSLLVGSNFNGILFIFDFVTEFWALMWSVCDSCSRSEIVTALFLNDLDSYLGPVVSYMYALFWRSFIIMLAVGNHKCYM